MNTGPRWALDGQLLDPSVSLAGLLRVGHGELAGHLTALARFGPAPAALLAPVDPHQEVWAAGVTYLRSREAREAESSVGDIYERVYDAARPELFMKAVGWRAVGHQGLLELRADSRWNVPEPELTLVVDAHGEIVGYCAGNDLSSRDIEGENPLYLPQAKIFNGACALGPAIELGQPGAVPIRLCIRRASQVVFEGETSTQQMKRSLEELVEYLRRELAFPDGVLLLTGTGIVPPDDFTLEVGDAIRIEVGSLELENRIGAHDATHPDRR